LSAGQSAKPSILIVDDTPANISLLVEALKADYRTRVANSGERALALARSAEPPDLILLDIMMPLMNGYALTPRSRLKGEIQRVRIGEMSSLIDAPSGGETGRRSFNVMSISYSFVL